MKLLIALKPLDMYLFSGESGPYDERGGYWDLHAANKSLNRYLRKKQSYLVEGSPFPPQSTVFGTVRYLMLHALDGFSVKKDGMYDQGVTSKMADWIGKQSLNLELGKQSFGMIQSVSPLMLLRIEKEPNRDRAPDPKRWAKASGVLLPVPSDAKRIDPNADTKAADEARYEKLAWNAENEIAPTLEGLNVKMPPRSEFICYSRNGKTPVHKGSEIVSQDKIFKDATRASIQTSKQDQTDKNNTFHMTKGKWLTDTYAFAVVVACACAIKTSKLPGFVTMGANRCPFSVIVETIEETDGFPEPWTVDMKKEADLEPEQYRIYSMSPTKLPEGWEKHCDFAMVEKQPARPASTRDQSQVRLSRGEVLYMLAKPGSSFFFRSAEQMNGFISGVQRGSFASDAANEKSGATIAGYNHFYRAPQIL